MRNQTTKRSWYTGFGDVFEAIGDLLAAIFDALGDIDWGDIDFGD